MEMGGNFRQILELGGTTIKGRRALTPSEQNKNIYPIGQKIYSPYLQQFLVYC